MAKPPVPLVRSHSRCEERGYSLLSSRDTSIGAGVETWLTGHEHGPVLEVAHGPGVALHSPGSGVPGLLVRFELRGRARGSGKLPVERLAVADAAAEELRPPGNDRKRVGPLGQKSPELRVMPAERVRARVPVCTDAGAQPLHLREQLFAGHRLEVLVHG